MKRRHRDVRVSIRAKDLAAMCAQLAKAHALFAEVVDSPGDSCNDYVRGVGRDGMRLLRHWRRSRAARPMDEAEAEPVEAEKAP